MILLRISMALLALAFAAQVASQDDPPKKVETAALTIIVFDEDGDPIFGASVSLNTTEAERDAARELGEKSHVHQHEGKTDRDGSVTLSVPVGERRTVTAIKYRRTNSAEVDIAPMKSGEERVVEISLKTRPDIPVTAVVVSAEDGKPLSGAEVRVDDHAGKIKIGGSGNSLKKLNTRSKPQANTDDEGRFTVSVKSWHRPGAWITAPGRSPVMVRMLDEKQARKLKGPIELKRSASLTGTVTAKTGDVPVGTRVRIVVPGSGLGHVSDDGERDFRFTTPDLLYVTRVKREGKFRFDELPVGVAANLVVVNGSDVVLYEPQPRAFEAGSTERLSLVLGGGATIMGHVTESDGVPASGLTVWLVPRETQSPGFFLSSDRPTSITSTDTDGRYAFENLADGEWMVGLAPDEPAGLSGDPSAYASLSARIRIEGTPVAQDFVLHRGLYIDGVVYAPDGETPVDDVYVTARQGTCDARGQMTGDGKFRVGPLTPGDWSVRVTPHGSNGPVRLCIDAAPFIAQPTSAASTDPIEVLLRRGAAWSAAGIDAASGLPVRTTSALIYRDRDHQRFASVPRDDVELAQLPTGRCALCLRADDGRFAVLTADLEPVEDRPLEQVELSPGGFVRVHYSGAAPLVDVELLRRDQILDLTTLRCGFSARLQGPVGDVRIRISTRKRRDPKVAIDETYEVQIRAGEVTRVDAR